MSLIRDFILATGLAALVGAFSGMAWIIGYTLIGQEVEDRLRGRIFAFVLSSVRIMLLLTIAVGPLLAGLLGEHSFRIGGQSRLRFSGPGLTLLIGGILALFVSYYATSRATPTRTRLRHLLRRRLISTGVVRYPGRTGLFISVDGVDPLATAAYTALVVDAIRARGLVVSDTAEPTDSPIGRRVRELLAAPVPRTAGVEPETAALLSAADRAEHVAAVISPALERGEVIVCDRYVLTSIVLHGGGRGADVERIRNLNLWGTGGLMPDLTLAVEGVAVATAPVLGAEVGDFDAEAAEQTLLAETDADPDRYVRCPAEVPVELPELARERIERLVETRASLIVAVPASPGPPAR